MPFFLADLNISVDCSFDHGVCDWKQDVEDDFDWNPADRDNGTQILLFRVLRYHPGQKALQGWEVIIPLTCEIRVVCQVWKLLDLGRSKSFQT